MNNDENVALKKERDLEKLKEFYDTLNKRKDGGNRFIISFSSKKDIHCFIIDLGSYKLENDVQNHKDHNVVFHGDLIRYTNNDGYYYENIKDVVVVAPFKSFMRMLSNEISNEDFLKGRKARIQYRYINKKKYSIVSCKIIDNLIKNERFIY